MHDYSYVEYAHQLAMPMHFANKAMPIHFIDRKCHANKLKAVQSIYGFNSRE